MPKGKQSLWLYLKYLYLNRMYFEDSLPKMLVISESNRLIRKAGISYFDSFPDGTMLPIEICLSRSYITHYPNEVNCVLLHEMVHIKLKTVEHGSCFKREIDYLRDEYNLHIPLEGFYNNYCYICLECGKIYSLPKRINTILYFCNECFSEIEELEELGCTNQ